MKYVYQDFLVEPNNGFFNWNHFSNVGVIRQVLRDLNTAPTCTQGRGAQGGSTPSDEAELSPFRSLTLHNVSSVA